MLAACVPCGNFRFRSWNHPSHAVRGVRLSNPVFPPRPAGPPAPSSAWAVTSSMGPGAGTWRWKCAVAWLTLRCLVSHSAARSAPGLVSSQSQLECAPQSGNDEHSDNGHPDKTFDKVGVGHEAHAAYQLQGAALLPAVQKKTQTDAANQQRHKDVPAVEIHLGLPSATADQNNTLR